MNIAVDAAEIGETLQDDAAPDGRPAGIPPEAIELKGENGRRVWLVQRPNGGWILYESLGDGQMSATAGRDLQALIDVYPDIDFGPALERQAAQEAEKKQAETETDTLTGVVEARDKLIEVTPGAKEALDRALHQGEMLELTAGSLRHMIESMGGKLDVTEEELEALLATNENRIGLTPNDMKILMEEAGPNGVTLAQIEEMMPKEGEARAKPSSPAGREDPECPGLVYGRGNREICLPLGAVSFADAAVRFTPGAKPSRPPFDFPGSALGEPNYRSTSSADFISIGCDGELVTQFTDNVLVDVEGVDLYIFEVGPFVEKTRLAISQDGKTWIDVGEIEGARSDVDIGPFVEKGENFSYVRLVNAGTSCGGYHSGADIDAVAAVGAEIRLSLDSALLFDVGKSQLKPEALAALDELAEKVASYGKNIKVTVEGHTDSTGSDADNKVLSEARAKSVWAYLSGKLDIPAGNVVIKGYGESRPVADNETEEGRQQNRRVDLLISPQNKFVK